jgi:hypothetical protein
MATSIGAVGGLFQSGSKFGATEFGADIVTLRLSSIWRVAKTSHLCLRATALMQIKIQPCVKLIALADETA